MIISSKLTKKQSILIGLLAGFFILAGAVYLYGNKKVADLNDKYLAQEKTAKVYGSWWKNKKSRTNNDSTVNATTKNTTAATNKTSAVTNTETTNKSNYTLHKGISTTYFWIGEGASEDNANISNTSSAWDEAWVTHYGGIDNPNKRNGYFPAFMPKENPFYFALPYNDFNEYGERKAEVYSLIPWAKSKTWGSLESMCKNQWIRIVKNGKECYAQWEDVGPFGETDKSYVFGTAMPKNRTNKNAGLDVSPAVKDYLGLSDIDKVDWQFIDASQVPSGEWKRVVTTSQIYWK